MRRLKRSLPSSRPSIRNAHPRKPDSPRPERFERRVSSLPDRNCLPIGNTVPSLVERLAPSRHRRITHFDAGLLSAGFAEK